MGKTRGKWATYVKHTPIQCIMSLYTGDCLHNCIPFSIFLDFMNHFCSLLHNRRRSSWLDQWFTVLDGFRDFSHWSIFTRWTVQESCDMGWPREATINCSSSNQEVKKSSNLFVQYHPASILTYHLMDVNHHIRFQGGFLVCVCFIS